MALSSASELSTRANDIAQAWIRHEDDWSGITDPKARRRIQNRRNQRMLRSRKQKGTERCGPVAPRGMQLMISSPDVQQQSNINSDVTSITLALKSVHILDMDSEHNKRVMRAFEAFAKQYYIACAPVIALRPSLTQFNFIRALWTNVEVLGLSSSQMGDDDALSPFNYLDLKGEETAVALKQELPAGLRPTYLQCATHHHPWIDLLPIAEMRDNLFRRGFENFDEDELCHDMRGLVCHDPGVLVWRDPWDPSGWEVTESFARTWSWALVGCWDLFRSTNRWRALRDEKPLFRVPLDQA